MGPRSKSLKRREKLKARIFILVLSLSIILPLGSAWGDFHPSSSRKIDLLRVNIEEVDFESNRGPKIPRYNRRVHFKHWLSDETSQTCFNTRALVLSRDSIDEVRTTERNECVVGSGFWRGKYSGQSFIKAGSVDVDHVVPLHNAYYSGAWRWSQSRRCHYSNYIQNRYHLMTVSRTENRIKGADGPELYMPPNEEFQCKYLSYWLKIKKVWGLSMTELEYNSIQQTITRLNCNPKNYKMSAKEFERERRRVSRIRTSCLDE